MIEIHEALELLKAKTPPPTVETVQLLEARDRVLAEGIIAPKDSPSYSNSAMDGFAVCWKDVQDTTDGRPSKLEIAGESQAGIPYIGSVQRGQAIRISTGAMIPEGTDSVIPIEVCKTEGQQLAVLKVWKPGQHVRYRGEEFKAGTVLLNEKTLIHSAQLALMASMGISEVSVYQRPRVAIIITGSELVAYDKAAASHQLHDSNRPMLEAAILEAGGIVTYQTQVFDDLALTIEALKTAEAQADIILLSGGVSVGPHDHVKAASAAQHFEEVFWRVKQKPGKPLYLSKKQNKILLGLPGNPVSAFMCLMHYGQPLIRYHSGGSFNHSTTLGLLGVAFSYHGNRTQMTRVRIESSENKWPRIYPLEKQGSHMLSSISKAQGYIIVPPASDWAKDKRLTVFQFNQGGV